MSVDTNVKGKNISAYRKLRHDGFQILVSHTLIGMVESMRVVTKGRLSKSLAVEFRAGNAATPVEDSCEI